VTVPVYLVDASIYIFRAYFSLPDRWHNQRGQPLNAVYGYTCFLLDLLAQLRPDKPVTLALAFDESLGTCFRNRLHAGYKASRELPDEDLAYQLECCRRVSELLGLACFSGADYEADDYIATLAARARETGQPVAVVTRDKDLGQVLLDDRDHLWDYAQDTRTDRAAFFEKFGVWPEQFADYQGLVGDPIDDIPGVPSIGAKTAARLIQAYGDLETLAQHREAISLPGLRGVARISSQLDIYWDQALLSRELARLAQDVPDTSLPAAYQLQSEALAALLDFMQSIKLGGGVVRRCQHLLLQVSG
jgi:5'-3' exonuclease